MKLNLGSGEHLRSDFINFDCIKIKKDGRNTTVVGKMQNIEKIFKPDIFTTIIAFHSLEHINHLEVLTTLKGCFAILKSGGNLIVEGPDIVGAYEHYVIGNKSVEGYIYCIFGEDFISQKKYGDSWGHKSGWTGTLMAKAMEDTGFKIKHIGKGLSHGMVLRDFRVEGIKP